MHRNANWIGDLGRVKSGDKIMLEIADDTCLGSKLYFKRTMMEAATQNRTFRDLHMLYPCIDLHQAEAAFFCSSCSYLPTYLPTYLTN